MNNIGFWRKYGIKILLFISFAFLITYFFFINDGCLPVGTSLDKSHWLSFWAGFLSFAGSLFLGAIALWQNEKANEMNDKLIRLQKMQLGVNKGYLLPVKNVEDTKMFNPMQDVQIGQIATEINAYEHPDSILIINLENRGTDVIHNCNISWATVNSNKIAVISRDLMIEVGEHIKYDFDLHYYKNDFPHHLDIELAIKMRNSCGVEYAEIFKARFEKINAINTYRYISYNYTIEDSEEINND